MKTTLARTADISTATSAWTTTTDGDVIIACGNGHRAFIPDHTVHTDGRVTPSLACAADGCDWHVFATLDGYTP